ncbi:hypothetical protein [Emticicia sp. SJ17W-69]|uniref:hypothetical protein n=1 Tax=Emticicia sp. SJ17W-69 TaxID=3421657 RepID=UPI003EBDBDA9
MAKNFMAGMKKTLVDLQPSTFSETEKIKKQIVVLDSLKKFIPPLTSEEYKQLESNILKHGCKDPLTVWETTELKAGTGEGEEPIFILIDGHNRYKICMQFGIDFKIGLLDFEDLDAVKDYMIDFQLGRRNLNPEQISYFRGLRYNREKTGKGKYNRGGEESIDIAEKLAIEHSVSPRTIKNDGDYAKGVEKLPIEIKSELLAGKIDLSKEEVQRLGKIEVSTEELNSIEDIKNAISKGEEISPVKSNQKLVKALKKDVIDFAKTISTKKDCEQLMSKISSLKKLLSA